MENICGVKSVSKFSLGQKVHVRSIISPTERIEHDKVIVQVPVILNGIVLYIHPEGRFINVDNGRYVESYQPIQVSSGWASLDSPGTARGTVRILDYATREGTRRDT